MVMESFFRTFDRSETVAVFASRLLPLVSLISFGPSGQTPVHVHDPPTEPLWR